MKIAKENNRFNILYEIRDENKSKEDKFHNSGRIQKEIKINEIKEIFFRIIVY